MVANFLKTPLNTREFFMLEFNTFILLWQSWWLWLFMWVEFVMRVKCSWGWWSYVWKKLMLVEVFW